MYIVPTWYMTVSFSKRDRSTFTRITFPVTPFTMFFFPVPGLRPRLAGERIRSALH